MVDGLPPEAFLDDETPVDPEAVSRVAPRDLDAEAAVLSAIMLKRSATDELADLKPEHFYSEANRRIYEAALHLTEQGQPADVVTIANRLRETDRLRQVGGAEYLGDIVDKVPAVSNLESYALIIRDKATTRAVIAACEKAAAEGYCDKGSAAAFADRTEQAIYEISRPKSGSSLEHLDLIQRRVITAIMKAAERGQRITGIPTGFVRYDGMTAGLHDGELTTIAARPGMGKTAFVMNVAVNVASDRTEEDHNRQTFNIPGVGVAVFSLEMDREALVGRILCSEGGVDLGKLRQGMLQDFDWSKLTKASQYLATLPIWIDDTAGISPIEIRAKVRRLQADVERHGEAYGKKCGRVGLVVIDYIQLASATGENVHSRQQEIGSITRAFKRIAKELRVPVIALSQLNREIEKRGAGNQRPQLSDLREAGDIEQDSDNVVFIHRDDYYDHDADSRGIAELIIRKQRNGPVGTVKIHWAGAYTRFSNLQPGDYPEDSAA